MGPDEESLALARYILAEQPRLDINEVDLGYLIMDFKSARESMKENPDGRH